MESDDRRLRELLESVTRGETDVDAALEQLRHSGADLGFAVVDTDRPHRRGIPEVIFSESKTVEQIVEIAKALDAAGQNVLCSRVKPEQVEGVMAGFEGLEYNEAARTLSKVATPREPAEGTALVLCAGTSDIPVAEEAVVTLNFLGDEVECAYDVGVAGIHRLLERRSLVERASVIIVVAGMEGALASVVAGLARAPVVAVPTSVGYGAAFGGVAALLSMLNSCSGGVAVVNIDNGFGAAQFADAVLRRGQ